jgi:hemin uptake protein HemP
MNNQRPAVKTWTSAELLGGAHEARIQHGAEVYRLLLTRNGKLILVK